MGGVVLEVLGLGNCVGIDDMKIGKCLRLFVVFYKYLFVVSYIGYG